MGEAADDRTGKRIGIFGGTFDPPHVGHAVAAVNTRFALRLDLVLMIPAAVPWQKAGVRRVSAPQDRLAMLYQTVDGMDGLEVSTIEIDRGGDSYSVDTLEALTVHGAPELFLIVGSDVGPLLDTWKNPARLRELATLVLYERAAAVDRATARPAEVPAGWRSTSVDVPQIAVSSTDIRDRVRHGRPIDGLVNPAVARYIAERGLYRSDVDENRAVVTR